MGASAKQMPGWDEACKDFPREVSMGAGGRAQMDGPCGMALQARKGFIGRDHQGITEPLLALMGVPHLLGTGRLPWCPCGCGWGSCHPMASGQVVSGAWPRRHLSVSGKTETEVDWNFAPSQKQ